MPASRYSRSAPLNAFAVMAIIGLFILCQPSYASDIPSVIESSGSVKDLNFKQGPVFQLTTQLPNFNLTKGIHVKLSKDNSYFDRGWFSGPGDWVHYELTHSGGASWNTYAIRGPSGTDFELWVLYRNIWYNAYPNTGGSNENLRIWHGNGRVDVVIFSFPWNGGSGQYRFSVTP